jgi:hypothetical protein
MKIYESSLNGFERFPVNFVRFDHLLELARVNARQFYANDKQEDIQGDLSPVDTVPPLLVWRVAVGVFIAAIGLCVLLRQDGPSSGRAAIFGVLCLTVGAIVALWSI